MLVGGLGHVLFSIYWNVIFVIFFRGVGIPPTSMAILWCILVYYYYYILIYYNISIANGDYMGLQYK